MDKDTNLHFGYTPTEYKKFKKYAWIYLIMFSLLYCFLYCTRLNIGSAQPYLEDMGWGKDTVGILTGVLFWTYGIGQLVNGRLSEIVGPTKFVFFAVLLSAAANLFICTQSPESVVLLAIVWGLNGYFQSMAWTPGLATLTKWWPGNSRGFATGFAHAFSGFGQVLAYAAVLLAFTGFGDTLGWKAGFFIPAMFPLVMLVLYKILAKPTPASIGLKEYVEEDPEKAKAEEEMRELINTKGKLYPYKYVLSNGRFVIWMVIAFATGLARYGLATWIPAFFKDQGLTSAASVASSIILPVGMGIGTLVVPWLTDRFCPTNRLPAVIISAVVGALSVVPLCFLDPTSSAQLIVIEVLLFIAGFCIYAINGTAWAYATDIGGRVFSGTSAGVLNFSAYMGAAVQAFVYGFILAKGGWNIVFISIAAFCALIVVLGFLGSDKKAKA